MNESNTTQIEGYGSMVCEAMNIDCTPLVSCLDSILKTFEDYLRLLETSEIEMITFQTSLNPVIEQKQNELMKSYRKIDDLELFLSCLKKSYGKLEAKMDLAEKKLGKRNKLKRFLGKSKQAMTATLPQIISEVVYNESSVGSSSSVHNNSMRLAECGDDAAALDLTIVSCEKAVEWK